MDNEAWRQFRLPFFDHETFALLTSHERSSFLYVPVSNPPAHGR
jgi:hypothetical protein